MGCDIHLFLERKTPKGWVANTPYGVDDWDSTIQVIDNYPRCYLLFGILAGVRCYDPTPLGQPRGVPKDCSQEYKDFVDKWGPDGHDHSFFNVAEIISCINEYTEDQKKVLEEFVQHILKMIAVMHPYQAHLEQPEDYRICFFFDN